MQNVRRRVVRELTTRRSHIHNGTPTPVILSGDVIGLEDGSRDVLRELTPVFGVLDSRITLGVLSTETTPAQVMGARCFTGLLV